MPVTHDINTAVKERIAGANADVQEAVIAGLAKVEIDRRIATMTKLVQATNDLHRDLKKLKPDHVTYAVDRTVAREEWSKKALDEKEALEKKIEKHEKALEKAATGDFGDAYSLANDKGGGEKKPE